MAEMPLDADRPVRDPANDLLARGPLVDQLSSWIRRAPTADGFVIGLTGPWGSGKSTVLHLLAAELKDEAAVVWFEPWLFSQADDLVVRFFEEIGAQLTRSKIAKWHLRRVASQMSRYAAALSPAATAVIGPAGQLIAAPERVSAAAYKSAAEQRVKLRRKLLQKPQRIVVLIDDIDRLEPRETREVLRLVKLVADLPGVVHVLSYARQPVEDGLKSLGIEDGRSYLEKIVQASLVVPPVSKDRLRDMTLDWLGAVIPEGALDDASWDPAHWSALVDGGIDAYLRTLRDGRRLANMAPAAVELCRGEVTATDVLALEAVRVFDPGVHEKLLAAARTLTGSRDELSLFTNREKADAVDQEVIHELLEGTANRHATTTVLRGLFPAAGHVLGGSRYSSDSAWLLRKRVASLPVLLRYLHLSLATDEVPSALVDEAVAALYDANSFRAVLAGMPDEGLNDLLDRLRARVGEQPDIDAVGCGLVLLDAVPRVPRRPKFFDVEPERRVLWLVESLVENLKTPSASIEAARSLIERAPTLSLRLLLLYRFRVPPDGPSRNPKLDLLDERLFDELRHSLLYEVRHAPVEDLIAEAHPLWLVTELGKVEDKSVVLERLRDPRLLVRLLTLAGTEVHPHTDGEISLHVDPLVNAAGPAILSMLDDVVIQPSALDEDVAQALRKELDRFRGLSNES